MKITSPFFFALFLAFATFVFLNQSFGITHITVKSSQNGPLSEIKEAEVPQKRGEGPNAVESDKENKPDAKEAKNSEDGPAIEEKKVGAEGESEEESTGEKESDTSKKSRTEPIPAGETKSDPVPPPTDQATAPPGTVIFSGKLLADYRTGSERGFVSLLTADGVLHLIPETIIVAFSQDDEPFKSLTSKEIGNRLLAEGGKGFRVETTEHFLIINNTSKAYAQWIARLFESLYNALDRYQLRRGLKLPDPEFPMVALVFSNRQEFNDYALRDLPNPNGIAAYYNRLSNRVILYDLSEEETGRGGAVSRRERSSRQIEDFLARPQAAFNVATIIHEATHQIAFNRGFFLRTGPYPLWLAEGLSMFFESPDENSATGWSRRGSVHKPNRLRLEQLRAYLETGPNDPIRALIRMENPNDAENLVATYALSWGLYYYLDDMEPKKLTEYIKRVATRPSCSDYPSDARIADFERVFGDDWSRFSRNFYKFIRDIK